VDSHARPAPVSSRATVEAGATTRGGPRQESPTKDGVRLDTGPKGEALAGPRPALQMLDVAPPRLRFAPCSRPGQGITRGEHDCPHVL